MDNYVSLYAYAVPSGWGVIDGDFIAIGPCLALPFSAISESLGEIIMPYLTDDLRRACLDIADRDPDGFETRMPTRVDYLAHQEWVMETFGPEIYHVYFRTNWGERSFV